MRNRLAFAVALAGILVCVPFLSANAQVETATNVAAPFNANSNLSLSPYTSGGLATGSAQTGASSDTIFNKYDLFVGYSYINGLQSGGEAAVTWNVTHNVGFTGDFSGHYKGVSVDGSNTANTTYFFLVGPKLTHHFADDKFELYLHVLAGGGHFNQSTSTTGEGGFNSSDTGLAIVPGGGLDWISSGKRWGWRVVDVDYINTQFTNGSNRSSFRVSTGLIYRFGH